MPAPSLLNRIVARWHIARANSARDRGNWRQARTHYSRALALSPARFEIWVQLGHAEKESGALDSASAAYSRAVAIAPNVADTHLQIGHLRKLQGDLEGAAESYALAFRLDQTLSDAPAALLGMGRTPPKTDAERIADLEASAMSTSRQEADRLAALEQVVEKLGVDLVMLSNRVDNVAERASVSAEFGVELSSTRAILGKVFERLAAAEHGLSSLKDNTSASPIRSAV